MKNKIKSNLLGIIIGGILFGGIGVLAATIESSTVAYTTSSNNNVSTVEDALNDLYGMVNIACYNGVCGKVSYRYWNNNFDGSSGDNLFDSTHMPATVYLTRALLEQNYSDFADEPVYIRSILIDGNVVGHESCFWEANNQKEFCLGPGYWGGTLGTTDATVGANTKIKLQRDMQNALSLESANISCSSSASIANCYVGDFSCGAGYSGYVDCISSVTDEYCAVYASGSAYCS